MNSKRIAFFIVSTLICFFCFLSVKVKAQNQGTISLQKSSGPNETAQQPMKRVGKYVIKKLSPTQLDSTRKFLSKFATLKDTVIVKYDFNNDPCWAHTDMKGKAFITKLNVTRNKLINQQLSLRPAISVFQFREKGRRFSKFKLKNDEILVDPGFLKKMIFNNNQICGNSAIILPSGIYLLINNDSHFEAVGIRKDELDTWILNSNVN